MADDTHKWTTPKGSQTTSWIIGAIGMLASMIGDPIALCIGLTLVFLACAATVYIHASEIAAAWKERRWDGHLTLPAILIVLAAAIAVYAVARVITRPKGEAAVVAIDALKSEFEKWSQSFGKQTPVNQGPPGPNKNLPSTPATLPVPRKTQAPIRLDIECNPFLKTLIVPPAGYLSVLAFWTNMPTAKISRMWGPPGHTMILGDARNMLPPKYRCTVTPYGGDMLNVIIPVKLQYYETDFITFAGTSIPQKRNRAEQRSIKLLMAKISVDDVEDSTLYIWNGSKRFVDIKFGTVAEGISISEGRKAKAKIVSGTGTVETEPPS